MRSLDFVKLQKGEYLVQPRLNPSQIAPSTMAPLIELESP